MRQRAGEAPPRVVLRAHHDPQIQLERVCYQRDRELSIRILGRHHQRPGSSDPSPIEHVRFGASVPLDEEWHCVTNISMRCSACYEARMGVTYLPARVRRADGRGVRRDVRFLVDSGALYSVLPEDIWRSLKLKPQRSAEFILADGTPLTRGVSECRFEIGGQAATSPVVLGEKDDGALLGAVTLETLGLMLNPLNRELVPMRLMLARLRR